MKFGKAPNASFLFSLVSWFPSLDTYPWSLSVVAQAFCCFPSLPVACAVPLAEPKGHSPRVLREQPEDERAAGAKRGHKV